MKPSVKTALLLGAILMAGSMAVWRVSQSERPRELAATTPQTSRTNIPPSTALVAPPIPGPVTTAPAPVPATVKAAVPAVSAATYAERVAKIHALPGNLSAQEIESLYAYLAAPATSPAGDRPRENWLRNEMMDKLVEAPVLPAGLVRLLVSIYQDPAQDVVMRDYAVQHMAPVYARASAEEQVLLQNALWQSVAETGSSIAGTGLLALSDLAPDHREFEPGKVGEVALKLAGDDRSGELSRITALQICGRLGLKEAAPLMLQVARTAGSIPLQIAAIAALGDVGNEEARAYLRQLAVQPEPRLLPALGTALRKLNERLGT
jgi:HEAT repeats